jgi:hypothetical protein
MAGNLVGQARKHRHGIVIDQNILYEKENEGNTILNVTITTYGHSSDMHVRLP